MVEVKADAQWIVKGAGGWVAKLLLESIHSQKPVLAEFTEEDRKKGYGFACKLIVDGPGGGIFLLWFCEEGVQPKPQDVPLRNIVYMTEDTLFDIVTPDLESLGGLAGLADFVEKKGMEEALSQLRPRCHPRKAFANQLISVDGEKPDIDSEMWAKIFDTVLYDIAFPMVVRGLVKKARERRK